jgi:hypothetical protein
MPPRKQDPSDEGTSKAAPRGAAKRSASASGAKPPSGSGPPPELTRNPDADPVRLHREYVQQRLAGGALPTPEAYARAVDDWQRLPGSVPLPATDVRAPEEPVPDEQLLLGSGEQPQAVHEEEEAPAATYAGPLPATDPGDNRGYEDRRS